MTYTFAEPINSADAVNMVHDGSRLRACATHGCDRVNEGKVFHMQCGLLKTCILTA
jgi:hypothetical protein